MKKGYLSQYFKGVASKSLQVVEVYSHKSNQHEFNGVAALKSLLGESSEKTTFRASFVHLSDASYEPLIESGTLTWYDARKKGREQLRNTRSERRLYFTSNRVLDAAHPGDLCVVARLRNDDILVIVAQKGATIANQVAWLFGIEEATNARFAVRAELETSRDKLALASRQILESIGIETEDVETSLLDGLLKTFGSTFPGTREFSLYARASIPEIDSTLNADMALIAWLEREELLFKTLEKHVITERLNTGFKDDVEGFINYSLSVQNRRKSRIGWALENHIEQLFIDRKVQFSRGMVTERRSRPDFLFPSVREYHNARFPQANLHMLGVKSTCKDRWRQVLSEADRIKRKHLLTLETAISVRQTDEMRAQKLQLIVPSDLQATYTAQQRNWLMNVESFIALVKARHS